MENVTSNPISRGALRIGKSLVSGAKMFKRGVASVVDIGNQTINRTGEKIKKTQGKIKTENKKQDREKTKTEEIKKRKEKESKSEAKTKFVTPVRSLVKNVLVTPLQKLSRIILAWALLNLPRIIAEVRKFIKKVKILGYSIKNGVKAVGGLFMSLVKIGSAFIKNLSEFDFNDKSGRIKAAKLELDDNMGEINTNMSEFINVWNREEGELDSMLLDLESGQTTSAAIDNIFLNTGIDVPTTTDIQPTTTAVGRGSSTASSSDWKPILDLIAKAESVNGSYDSIYPSSIKPGLSQMTIAEADAWQARTASQRGSAAAGRYQFMDIKGQAAFAGIGANEIFSPENQDKMAIALIEKKRGVSLSMIKENPKKAAKRLAMEWAGLPVLEQTRGNNRIVSAGQSYYAGDGRNKATIGTDELTGAFSKLGQTGQSRRTQSPQPSNSESSGSLVNKVSYSNFSKSSAEGGSGSVGKTDGYLARGGRHKGIDIGTSGQKGWYVALKVNGTVSYVGAPDGLSRGAGRMVIIRDAKDASKEYVFMHLERYSVRSGQKYRAGDPIGEIGNTGGSFGEHLHFEVRINNRHIDPGPYLKLLEIGKLRKKSSSQVTTISSNATKNADSMERVASSRTTGGTKTKTKVIATRQKEIVMVG